MRILQIEAPNVGGQGDHVYRTRQPCRALGELPGVVVASGSWLSPAVPRLLASADVLVLCDVVDADLLPVIAGRRRSGRLTVYEVNDHFRALQSWNQTAYLAENLLTRSLSAQLAGRADANQFTTPELIRSFGSLNTRHAVFPNHMWQVPPLVTRPDSGTVWLGWGGSLGHRQDLAWAMPTLQRALDRHPQLKLAIMGPEELRPLFAWVPGQRLRFSPGGKIEGYYQFLRGLDIGVCPLLPTDFNRCRSDVKFLELAAHGVAAICSELPPYVNTVRDGQTGLLFATLDQLGSALDALVTDAGRRRTLAAAAHAYVREQRIERQHVSPRRAFYEGLQAAPPSDAPARPDDAWGNLAAREPSFTESAYYLLSGSELEGLLYKGLTHVRDGQPQEALRLYAEAARLAPDNHLPLLLEGAAQPDAQLALELLHEAVTLGPGSPSASLLYATRLEATGDLAGAARELARCQAICPDFGAAEARLAALAERAGRTEAAVAHHQAALAANPYFAEPALRLGLQALDRGDAAAATEIVERAVSHDGGLWSLRFLLGRAHLAAGRAQAARAELERALESAPDPVPVLAQLAQAYVGLGNVEAARMVLGELHRLSGDKQAR
jgi:tetratricopeptide (TPR) repeat protein